MPANKEYSLICLGCGDTLLDDINGLTRKQWEDIEAWTVCPGLGETLGVEVSDGVGTEDHFGGVE